MISTQRSTSRLRKQTALASVSHVTRRPSLLANHSHAVLPTKNKLRSHTDKSSVGSKSPAQDVVAVT